MAAVLQPIGREPKRPRPGLPVRARSLRAVRRARSNRSIVTATATSIPSTLPRMPTRVFWQRAISATVVASGYCSLRKAGRDVSPRGRVVVSVVLRIVVSVVLRVFVSSCLRFVFVVMSSWLPRASIQKTAPRSCSRRSRPTRRSSPRRLAARRFPSRAPAGCTAHDGSTRAGDMT